MRKLVINAVDRKEILKLIRKKNSINKSLRKRKMKDRKGNVESCLTGGVLQIHDSRVAGQPLLCPLPSLLLSLDLFSFSNHFSFNFSLSKFMTLKTKD